MRICSRSYGTVAVKLFCRFCRCCHLVMSVSTPRILDCTSRTASSVGMGRMSMDNNELQGKSRTGLFIISSLIKDAWSRINRTHPNLPPISKYPARNCSPSGQIRSRKSMPRLTVRGQIKPERRFFAPGRKEIIKGAAADRRKGDRISTGIQPQSWRNGSWYQRARKIRTGLLDFSQTNGQRDIFFLHQLLLSAALSRMIWLYSPR